MPVRGHALTAVGVLLVALLAGCSQQTDDQQPSPGAATSQSPLPTAPSQEPSRSATDATPSASTDQPTMAALGDSITAGFNATQPLQSQLELSWSTGTDPEVNSIYARLRTGEPGLRASNLAVPGARMRDLAGQARRLPEGAELATVLLGANDACAASVASMTSVDAFRAATRAGLAVLADAHVQTIVLASVPDLHRLWQVGSKSSAAVRTWATYGICPSMLANPLSTAVSDQARRDQVRARVAAYDGILEAQCRAVTAAGSGTTCRFDAEAVTDSPFTLADVSTVDYFHPSPGGQARLAAAVFAAAHLPTD